MRLLYVDEAGISDREPFLVVAGVVVDADSQLLQTKNALSVLRTKWIPEDRRGTFVFHAKELFNGGGSVFRRDDTNWPLERRLAVADDLASLPQQLGLRISMGVMAKPDHIQWGKRLTRQLRSELHAITFLGCAAGLENWMRNSHQDEVCMIVAEDNPEAREKIKEAVRAAQTMEKVREQFKGFLPIIHIQEDPLFQPKRPGSALEIADFVCYVMRKRYERDERFKRFWTPLLPTLLPPVFPDRDIPQRSTWERSRERPGLTHQQ